MKNNMDVPFPTVTKSLLDALNEVFPKRDFDTSVSLRELDFHYGQRAVVNFLMNKLKEQSENILTSEN